MAEKVTIGNCELWNGDCLQIMAGMPNESVDMVLCDLPYGTTACKWDTVIPFEPLWEQYKRLIKPRGAIVLFGSEPFSSALRMSAIDIYKYDWVWDKKKGGNPLLAKKQPIKVHEMVSVFSFAPHEYFPIMTPRDKPKRRGANSGRASETTGNAFTEDKTYYAWYPKSILEISNADQSGRVHPTQKPVALCEYLIRTYTNEGETVLDNTMGSGTTGVACANTGRKFIGIEQDARYFQTARDRIAKVGAGDTAVQGDLLLPANA